MRESDTVVTRLKNVRDAIEQIKSVQSSGTSNVTAKLSQTGSTWDIDVTIDTSTGEVEYFFVFTADNQTAPFVSFHPSILVNGAEYEATGSLEIDQRYGFALFGGFSSPVDFNKSVGFSLVFFDLAGGSFPVKVKMRCLGTDTGSITVQLL